MVKSCARFAGRLSRLGHTAPERDHDIAAADRSAPAAAAAKSVFSEGVCVFETIGEYAYFVSSGFSEFPVP